MSLILLGILNSQVAGGGPTGYWISTWDSGPANLDFSYSKYSKRPMTQYADNVTSNATQVVHWNSSDGTIASQFYVEGVSPDTRVTEERATQTTNYDYLAVNDESTGNSDVVVIQFDAQSSSPNWQQRFGLGTGGSNNLKLEGIGSDSSENVYFLARDESSSQSLVAKLNSSGTVQWQKKITADLTRDSHTNASGQTIIRDLNNDFIMLDSNGNIDFQIGGTLVVGGVTTNISSNNHLVDDSGNTYFADYALGNSSYMAIVKLNSSGAVQWQKYLLGTSAAFCRGLGIASDGSLIAVTQSGGEIVIVSLDVSDGSINWQRGITHTRGGITATGTTPLASFNTTGSGIVLNVRDKAGGTYNLPAVIQYPDDGSITGTFTIDTDEWVIAASSLSTGNITNNFSTLSNTTSTGSYSLGSTSMTIGTTTYTATETAI